MKIACIQLNGSTDIEANIARIRTLVQQAVAQGAQFVALPENAFMMEEQGKPRTLYMDADHPGIKAAADMARTHKIWLLAGSLAVKVDDSGKTVNRSMLFDDTGRLVTQYDKIHLFDVEVGDGQVYKESAKIIPGSRAVLATTPWAKIGLTICYDLRFPQLYRALAKAGAQILAVPAAFTRVTGEAHWHVLLRARAIENGCFVIAPGQCGTHAGNRQTYGHSLIIDPWGRVLADAGTEEGVIVADIDIGLVDRVRAQIPAINLESPFCV